MNYVPCLVFIWKSFPHCNFETNVDMNTKLGENIEHYHRMRSQQETYSVYIFISLVNFKCRYYSPLELPNILRYFHEMFAQIWSIIRPCKIWFLILWNFAPHIVLCKSILFHNFKTIEVMFMKLGTNVFSIIWRFAKNQEQYVRFLFWLNRALY